MEVTSCHESEFSFFSLRFVYVTRIVYSLSIMFTAMRNIWFLVTFISCVCYGKAKIQRDGCDTRYVDPEWLSPSSTSPPGWLSWPPQVSLARGEIAVQVSKIKDDLTLSMFALPFVKSEVDCLPAERVHHKLAKFWRNYTLSAGIDEYEPKTFNRTFTGCYYFELANSTNHKWIWDGFFLNSTIQYNDTKLGCERRFESTQADESMQLSYNLSVGLTCLMLHCKLWELEREDDYTPADLDSGRIRPSQECDITYIENEMLPGVECSEKSGQHLTLSPGPVTVDERGRWTTDVTWTNLREGGAYYYAQLLQFNNTCTMTMTDLTAWRPAVQVGGIIHGFQNKDGRPALPENTNNGFYTTVVGITTGMIIMVILVYWVVRYAKIVLRTERLSSDGDANPQIEDAEAARLNIGEDSDGILLVYAKGSPEFMDKMGEFRSHLQNTCDCTVHDVYSPDDFPELAEVGVSDWVKQRLGGGCKVVWVDTPHFRSLFDGEPRPNTNFRDNAIPYAVKLATDLFQDPATQYRRHFVVRIESLQVEKGHADPLLVISPHKRYYIPQHLDKLCDHLTK